MNPWRGLGSIPRPVWVLCGATLVNRAGSMVLPFLVLYLTRGLGVAPSRAGLVLALYGITAIAVGPLSGRLSDRLGPALLMKASLATSGVVMLLFPLGRTPAGIAIATIALAATTEPFRPASLAVLTDLVRPDQRKQAFALNRLAINLGMSIGPAVGGLLARASFRSLFVVDGVTSLAAGALLVLAGFQGGRAGGAPPRARSLPAAGFKDPALRYFLLAATPVIVVFFQHVSSMPLFMVHNLGLNEVSYGLLFTLSTLLIVAFEVPLNNATAGWPHRRTLAAGSILVAVGFGALALVHDLTGVAATVVVWSFGEMILLPGMSAYVADLAPPERRGEYMALFTTSISFGFSAGPWLGTWLLEHAGGRAVWVVMLGLGLLSAALMARVPEPRPDLL